jgi:hypothetical protein
MANEEKQLLLKVLCAMLPYGVKIFVKGHDTPQTIQGILSLTPNISFRTNDCYSVYLTDIKPYLRPMSSMTDDERDDMREELEWVESFGERFYDKTTEFYDWMNAHHFDYRGLIEKGLALEAPEDMYSKEDMPKLKEYYDD